MVNGVQRLQEIMWVAKKKGYRRGQSPNMLKRWRLPVAKFMKSMQRAPEPKKILNFSRILLDTTEYETGVSVSSQQIEKLNLRRHSIHPEWNYTISPQTT
jgi:hypothetical protein